jgi:anti-sigma B factor antagonist
MERMSIEYVAEDGVGYIRVTDDLDLASADKLREMGELALSGDSLGTVRIDMSGVPFMDSTGVSALLAIQHKADHDHHVLIIENPSERVLRVLELTGLTEYFQIK